MANKKLTVQAIGEDRICVNRFRILDGVVIVLLQQRGLVEKYLYLKKTVQHYFFTSREVFFHNHIETLDIRIEVLISVTQVTSGDTVT